MYHEDISALQRWFCHMNKESVYLLQSEGDEEIEIGEEGPEGKKNKINIYRKKRKIRKMKQRGRYKK